MCVLKLVSVFAHLVVNYIRYNHCSDSVSYSLKKNGGNGLIIMSCLCVLLLCLETVLNVDYHLGNLLR